MYKRLPLFIAFSTNCVLCQASLEAWHAIYIYTILTEIFKFMTEPHNTVPVTVYTQQHE